MVRWGEERCQAQGEIAPSADSILGADGSAPLADPDRGESRLVVAPISRRVVCRNDQPGPAGGRTDPGRLAPFRGGPSAPAAGPNRRELVGMCSAARGRRRPTRARSTSGACRPPDAMVLLYLEDRGTHFVAAVLYRSGSGFGVLDPLIAYQPRQPAGPIASKPRRVQHDQRQAG